MRTPDISTKYTRRSEEYYYEQGKEFETYVRNLFGAKFKLARWRKSQLIPKDTYIGNLSYPDLDLIFQGAKDYKFAVECKFRSRFKNGEIEWATRKQIDCYEKFEKQFNSHVFIAIGVGGSASNPEYLFVTPLCNIRNWERVHENQLIPYKRKVSNKFFYDTIQLRLW